MDQASLAITLGVFIIFVVLAGYYYFYKKASDKALLLFIFGVIFVIASVANLLDFILPILFLLFFISIFTQYLRKKQLHQLVWSISLFMFFLTTLFQAVGALLVYWDLNMLRLYYVLASFQVLLLGSGELYLLSKRNVITKNVNIAVIFISGFFWMLFGFIYLAQTNEQTFLLIALVGLIVLAYGVLDLIFAIIGLTSKGTKSVVDPYQVTGFQYSNFVLGFSIVMFFLSVFFTFTITPLAGFDLHYVGSETVINSVWGNPSVVRAFAPLFTVNGAMFIFLGSIYSYLLWQFSIKKSQGKFSFGTGIFNIYFALGVAIFTAGGTLSQFGTSVLYISELLGGIFMYFGFLESDKISMEMILDIVTLRFLHKKYPESKVVS